MATFDRSCRNCDAYRHEVGVLYSTCALQNRRYPAPGDICLEHQHPHEAAAARAEAVARGALQRAKEWASQ